MAETERSWVPWLGAAAIVAAVGWWVVEQRARPGVPPAERAPRAGDEDGDGASPPVASDLPTPAPPPPDRPRSTASMPPPVSAAAPPGCPDDAVEDPPGFVRPAVWELLRLRTQELRDRLPQLSRDGSPALRQGLRGLNGDDPTRAAERIAEAPDHVRDGFDVSVAALLLLGMRAIGDEDPRAAWHHARIAAGRAPDDPLPHALASLAADRMDDPENARREMGWAVEAAPDEPALALVHARQLAEVARYDQAVPALDRYLAAVPEDARVRSWRARLAIRRTLAAGHGRRRGRGVVVAHPGRVAPARVDRLTDALREAMDEVATLTRTARRPELAVVIYDDREAMRRATCAPSWSGGIFDGVLHLDVATVNGSRGMRVARHEATHAQLATLRGRVPHWLNEGLAQHLEGAPSRATRAAWARMVAQRFWIPFASLEGQLVVIDDPDDAQLAYHQSLAMVRYLLDARGDAGLAEAARHVEAGEARDLLERLVPSADGEALLAFLAAEGLAR